MSSVLRDTIEGHKDTALAIQSFMWEGKPFKSHKREHTAEELEEFLEMIRKDAWSMYDEGAYELGWK
ncbi:hypothetical protein [Bacillus pumilus]|uniref:hypothetical protein n=1 Tax=Bacillus pumilus TaxID=1408 RepID=UPI002280EF57|nr:hypothetical protein [Bacillus pumilus]MCY7500170.1 hypothetical protein [Bacillus pumilus]MCY7528506.1 hypothetical protein [Bacillus pumilus]MED4439536.1 hypothetical protein [Bacillus pumilus]MED4489979.1 hypothetical protein [Bacillus pumilus]